MDWLREWAPFGVILFIVWEWWRWDSLCYRVGRIDRRVESLFDDILLDEEPEESGGK